MNNIEKAKNILKEENYTCVLCKNDLVYTSREKGISPLLDYIDSDLDLKGFSVADKIIGKAVAMLCAYAGVVEVYGEVMSQAGANYLQNNGIAYSYGTLTAKIINRKGDGVCPMEMTVENIDDKNVAFKALKDKRDELRNKK